jgi:hypothetical protein
MNCFERGNIEVISTDYPEADGHYIVEWSGQPYQTEQVLATTLQDTNPPMIVPKADWWLLLII